MNWLDYVFMGILGISIIVSLFRGFIREVLSLLIWVAAFWLAYRYVNTAAEMLTSFIELPSARHIIAFVALFLAALIVGGMINFLISKLIKKTGLTATDRFFGIFFGATRGLIAIVAITFFVQATPLSEDPWWQESRLVPQFSKISEWARLKMPEELAGYFSFIGNSKELKMQDLIDSITNEKQAVTNETEQNDKHPQTNEVNPTNEEH